MQLRRAGVPVITIVLIFAGLTFSYFLFSSSSGDEAQPARTDVPAAPKYGDDSFIGTRPAPDPAHRNDEARDRRDRTDDATSPARITPPDEAPQGNDRPEPETPADATEEGPGNNEKPEPEEPTATVSGRVYDHSGTLVPNALLRFNIRTRAGGPIGANTRTDDGGFYSLEFGFPWEMPEFRVEITTEFHHDVFAVRGLRQYEFRANVDFTLTPKGAVIGRVLTTDGAPLANVKVQAFDGQSLVGGETTASDGFMYVTNESGRYRLINLPPGTYLLHPMGAPELTGYGPVERIRVTVEASKATEAPDIVMSQPRKVRARVLRHGDPVSNTRTLAYFYGEEGFLIGSSMPTQTDEDGWALFEGVPASSVAFGVRIMGRLLETRALGRITLTDDIFEYGDVNLDDPVETATVRLRLMVDGQVYANRGLAVNLLDSDGWEVPRPGLIFGGFPTRTDAEGWFELEIPVTAASLVIDRRVGSPVALTSTLIAGQAYDLGTVEFDE
jgi:hypothetical protein